MTIKCDHDLALMRRVLAYGVVGPHGRSGFYMGARSMEHVGRTELRACFGLYVHYGS